VCVERSWNSSGIPGGYAHSGECVVEKLEFFPGGCARDGSEVESSSLAVARAAVSICSSVAVARAAVSEHWEGEFLSYPGSYARSG
jgi:hypothetical protein